MTEILTSEEILDAVVLGELTNETCRRLGFRMAPEVVLHINRAAYARAVEHGLHNSKDFKKVAEVLEEASKHVEETETRWGRNGRSRSGFWWEKLATAYEMYWTAVNGSTGFFLQTLAENGIELPPAPDGTPA